MSSPTRGCFGRGATPSIVNTIDFIEIATTGNAIDFGDLSQSRRLKSNVSSSTRGITLGGFTPSVVSTVDFITIASQGNAIDYVI